MPDFALVAVRVTLGLVLLVALANIVLNVRRSRKAPYFILRQAAATRFLRWLAALAVAGIALGLSFWVRLPPLAGLLPTPEAPLEATLTATSPSTSVATVDTTDTPSLSTDSQEASPSPEETAISSTPSPSNETTVSSTPSPMFATRESDVTPQAEASITITAISTELGFDFLPIDPGTVFGAGVTRFYIFYDFEGMSDGASWSVVVLADGQLDEDASFDRLWESGEAAGSLYLWFDRNDGWPPGEYEVQIYIGDQQADSTGFQLAGS